MPIASAQDGRAHLIPGSAALAAQMGTALEQVEFADLFEPPGTIAVAGQVRIDVQGPWGAGPGRTIQAQTGLGSLAAIRLADELGQAATPFHQGRVLNAARQAVLLSYATGNWIEVTGTSP